MSPRVREIMERIAAQHHCTVNELVSPSRTQRLARARFHAMYEIRQLRGLRGERSFSYPAIAELFGDRDHTTAMHGVRRWIEINSLHAEDVLIEERAQLLITKARYEAAVNNARIRIAEIDALLSKAEAA